MKVMLISSSDDDAGKNIREKILALKNPEDPKHGVFNLCEVKGRLITQDGIDARFDTDLIIFLSRHTSTHPAPLLSVHVTGNLSHADLGGTPFTLPPASPLWMRSVFCSLVSHAPAGYRVTYEVTHHGPTGLSTPSFFVEIGSTPAEWNDPQAGIAVAKSILSAEPASGLSLLGIGGDHYARRATEIVRESRAAFGHLVHSREVPCLDPCLLRLLKERSGADAVYLDRNSLSPSEVRRVERMLGEVGLLSLSESEIRAMRNISWETYQSLRLLAEAHAPGSRMSVHRLSGEGIPVLLHVDPQLLSEALKADRDAVMNGLHELPLVHLAGNDGKPLSTFLTFEGNQSSVINHLIRLCVKIIVGKQKTSLDGDSLIIHSMRFDPQKARDMGIPSGPLYGMLSAGHTIEKDGRMITPEMVQTETKRILHIPGLGRYV